MKKKNFLPDSHFLATFLSILSQKMPLAQGWSLPLNVARENN
jgi:hypothetical protein